jgi:hypothetical protein
MLASLLKPLTAQDDEIQVPRKQNSSQLIGYGQVTLITCTQIGNILAAQHIDAQISQPLNQIKRDILVGINREGDVCPPCRRRLTCRTLTVIARSC